MSDLSPVAILYDADGNPVAVDLDGEVYRLQTRALIEGTQPDGSPVKVAVDANGNIRTLPAISADAAGRMINLSYDESDGAIQAGSFKRVLEYTVPAGYNGSLVRYTSHQDEAADSRLIVCVKMGTLDLTDNTYVEGDDWTEPQFASSLEAMVTTALGAITNTTVTATYTNQDGTAARTATVLIPKSSSIGARFRFTLQGDDFGVRSVEDLSTSPLVTTGAIQVGGNIQLAFHHDLNATIALETLYASNAVTFLAGTDLAIEYAGGVVSKTRQFDALVQLEEV